MPEPSPLNYEVAIADFKRMRRKAAVQQLMARLTGHSDELLAYDEVAEHLHAVDKVDRGVQEIPVGAIVGSVGRSQDFTRDFLPKRDVDEERWARVKAAVLDMRGLPPIDVYQVGEVYFVKDGNHRVSVARQLGTTTISAHVTEVRTRVPLTVSDDLEEIICKERYVDFLDETGLAQVRPGADLYLTFCSEYPALLAQIEARRQRLAEERGEAVSLTEAAAAWYDHVYAPVRQVIREQGILRHFPEYTEGDIYLLLLKHRRELEAMLGWSVDTEAAVAHLAEHYGREGRLGARLLDAVLPEELAEGPAPGLWRRRVATRRHEQLFSDILVAIRGSTQDWKMLDQAIEVARRENGRLLGLHVAPDAGQRSGPLARKVEAGFLRRCRQAGIQHEFVVQSGEVVNTIVRRAAWADLVMTSVTHPPGRRPFARLGSGFVNLIQRCPRPVLAMPGRQSPMDRALLGYDGSPKSQEALFVAAYLALRWETALTVITVETEFTSRAAVRHAEAYLAEYGVQATCQVRQGDIAAAMLETAAACRANLLIMGGFGFRPVLHLMLGSTVERVLREFRYPVFICR